MYGALVGGALALTGEHMKRTSGYSTSFYGWGGEDDDMYTR